MFLFQMNMPLLPNDYNIPPTIHSILNSIVNFDREEKIKTSQLASYGRNKIFDFNYPINESLKEELEIMILNHFMMRRIGYETLTAFKLALNVKLNEIMPMYNKLFNAIKDWEIFIDGEETIREVNDSRNTTTSDTTTNSLNNITNSSGESDRRFSDTPQNSLADVKSGEYVSQYNFDKDLSSSDSTTNGNSISNGTNNNVGNLKETVMRTPADKMKNYIEFIKEKQNIYTMIFKDLDSLFYQVI